MDIEVDTAKTKFGAIEIKGDGNTNILSTPTLLTMDNEEAKFSVGQEVPFLTGSFSNTGSSMTLDSAVTAADNAVIYPGEGGAEGCAVYGCLFVGKGAYGVVDLNDGTEVIVKPRGSSGTADPLDQRSSVGWKGVHAAAILYDEYIVRVECGSSYSGQDKAN